MFAIINSFWFLGGRGGKNRLDENGACAPTDVSRVTVIVQIGIARTPKGVSQIIRRGKSVMISHEEELRLISSIQRNGLELRRQETRGIRPEMTVTETVDHRR